MNKLLLALCFVFFNIYARSQTRDTTISYQSDSSFVYDDDDQYKGQSTSTVTFDYEADSVILTIITNEKRFSFTYREKVKDTVDKDKGKYQMFTGHPVGQSKPLLFGLFFDSQGELQSVAIRDGTTIVILSIVKQFS
jgi:hypothetical protein